MYESVRCELATSEEAISGFNGDWLGNDNRWMRHNNMAKTNISQVKVKNS